MGACMCVRARVCVGVCRCVYRDVHMILKCGLNASRKFFIYMFCFHISCARGQDSPRPAGVNACTSTTF